MLVEILILLGIVAAGIILALPNLNMAKNRSMMHETIQTAHSLSMGLENLRVELLKDEFVRLVNQLSEITDLNQQNTPWLVPKYIEAQKTVSAWGGRYLFDVDAQTGQVNIGVPGRTGRLGFTLKAAPERYELQRIEDFNLGLVFRDGKMVIGPHISTDG